jgi:hypothetical protein
VDGTTVVQSGSWYEHEPLWPGVTATFIVEAEMSAPFPSWVAEGGYTADEPESYMALRHFYDPRKRALDLETGRESTYLTDVHDPWIANLLMGHNPRVDARAWALEVSPYAWRVGANALDLPAQGASVEARRRAYGRAWRALGETLHLLADMTVPAHVRNDAHPGGWAGVVGALGPDPYEASVTEAVVARWADTEAPQKLRDLVKHAPTPSALFPEVAAYEPRLRLEGHRRGTDAVTRQRLGNAICSRRTRADLDILRYTGEQGGRGSTGRRRDRGPHAAARRFACPTTKPSRAQAADLVPSAIEAGVRLLQLCHPALPGRDHRATTRPTALTVRAVRLRNRRRRADDRDPIPCDPSSSAWVVLFADADGARRTVAAPATQRGAASTSPSRTR